MFSTEALPAGSPPQAGDGRRRLSRSDRLQPLLLIGAIGVGLGLALGRLRWGRQERRFVLVAVVLNFNFIFVPALAWGLGAAMLGDHLELRVGLLLFLVTPGGSLHPPGRSERHRSDP